LFQPAKDMIVHVFHQLAKVEKFVLVDVESDYALSQFAPNSFILTSDSDLLVYSKCRGIIIPQKRSRSIVLRDSVLKELMCSSTELTVAASIAGNDYSRGVYGYGIKKALKLLSAVEDGLSFAQTFDSVLELLPQKCIQEAKECRDVGFRVISNYEAPVAIVPIPELPDHKSMLSPFMQYLIERRQDGHLRRPGLLALFVRGPKVFHSAVTRNKNEWRVSQKQKRIEDAQYRVGKKMFQFSFNPFSCLEVYGNRDESECEPSASDASDETEGVTDENPANLSQLISNKRQKIGLGRESKEILFNNVQSCDMNDATNCGLSQKSEEPIRKTRQRSEARQNVDRMRALYSTVTRNLGQTEHVLDKTLNRYHFATYLQRVCLALGMTRDSAAMTMTKRLLVALADPDNTFTLPQMSNDMLADLRNASLEIASMFPDIVFRRVADKASLGEINKIVIANLKSMVMTQFQDLVETSIRMKLTDNLRSKLARRVARLIRGAVLGRRGRGPEGDVDVEESTEDDNGDDDTDSESDSEENANTWFVEAVDGIIKWKSLKPPERSFLEKLLNSDSDYLRKRFMPIQLHAIIPARHSGWRKVLSKRMSAHISTILRFIHGLNKDHFIQSIFPGPTTNVRMMTVTTTVLAKIFHDFIEHVGAEAKQDILGALSRSCSKPLMWTSIVDLIKAPDLLWGAIFPGYSSFCAEHSHLRKAFHGKTDGTRFHFGVFDTSKPTARKAGSAAVLKHGSGVGLYGYSNLLRFVKDGVLDLSLLAGGRFVDTGLGKLSGNHGILNVDQAFAAELIKPLPEQAIDDLIDNHPFVMIDLGVVSEMSMTATLARRNGDIVECDVVPASIKTAARYEGYGIDKYFDKPTKNQEWESRLSVSHSRTVDPAKYQLFEDVFRESGWNIKQDNVDLRLQRRHKLENRKRSYWASIPNKILALVDALVKESGRAISGAPIVVIGNPTFKSSMKGKRASAPKAISKYLRRFFVVLVIDEFNSSKLCPCCETQLEQVRPKHFRVWKCLGGCKDRHGSGPLIVNKDVSASLTFFKVLLTMLATGKRPKAYIPNYNCDKNKSR
jgi:hypothetical protein